MAFPVEVENDSLRQRAADAAKKHKASWIELGQYLYTIHKDKLFKSWGYLSFETYCAKELGVKQTTASKLLKSYLFLEKEEPRVVQIPFNEEELPVKVPNYESVNLLRLAKENEKITPQDFAELRESVLSKAREPKEVRAQVQRILTDREDRDPREVKKQRRNAAIKRLVSMLSNTKRELESEDLLPDYLIKQMADLTKKLQDQLED